MKTLLSGIVNGKNHQMGMLTEACKLM